MVIRPIDVNPFEFVVVAALRAQQLLAGCVPRLEGLHGAPTMAQMEVAGGQVTRSQSEATPTARQCGWQL
jgi:DNA-directed RNA polymerase subunit K/omega